MVDCCNTGSGLTIDQNNALVLVRLQDLEILHGVPLSAHISGHLLAGVHTTTTSLTITRGTSTSVRERMTVTPRLTAKAPSLHDTLEALALAITPRVNILTLHEPAGVDSLSHCKQTPLIAHSKLLQVAFGRHPLHGKMAQFRLADVLGMFGASPDTHSIVSVLLHRLVVDDLIPFQLQHRTGYALAGFRVVDGGHAALDGQCAGA